MASGLDSNLYKHGLFGGWRDYRYGAGETAKKRQQPKPVFPPGKRKHLVSILFNTMTDWRSSPFEYEGPMVHGIRSHLCLQGHGWEMADAEARFLVKDTLRLIGIPRPDWNEGQPGYTDSPDRCSWCSKPVDTSATSKASRYCSTVCAKSAFESRDFARRQNTDKAYAAARRVISRSRTTARSCEECGSSFQPVREKSKQRFCSYTCGAKHRSRVAPPFAMADTAVTLSCAMCGADFQARNRTAAYCTKACANTHKQIRDGYKPKLINVRLFDYLFTKPVNAAPRRLTPTVFDRLFEAA